MQIASKLLLAEITVREAMEEVRSSEFRTLLVMDRRGVIGVINFARLERELVEGADKKVGELVDALIFPHVHPDQGLDAYTDFANPRCRASGYWADRTELFDEVVAWLRSDEVKAKMTTIASEFPQYDFVERAYISLP